MHAHLTLPETKQKPFVEAYKREIIELDNWHLESLPAPAATDEIYFYKLYTIASGLIRGGATGLGNGLCCLCKEALLLQKTK